MSLPVAASQTVMVLTDTQATRLPSAEKARREAWLSPRPSAAGVAGDQPSARQPARRRPVRRCNISNLLLQRKPKWRNRDTPLSRSPSQRIVQLPLPVVPRLTRSRAPRPLSLVAPLPGRDGHAGVEAVAAVSEVHGPLRGRDSGP